MTNPLDAWVNELCAALGLDPSVVDRTTVLDLARDAAHNVARPAAPLTTFDAGFAAGVRGGSATDIADAVGVVQRLLAARPPVADEDPAG
jgi:hypothetical protein